MFFSKLARVLAIAALVLGLLRVLMGFAVANMEPYEAARARYLGNATSGKAIDQGIYMVLFAVALGTLAEISFSMRKGSSAATGQGASAMGHKQPQGASAVGEKQT